MATENTDTLLKVKTVEWFDDRWYKIVHGDKVEYYPSVTTKLGIIENKFLARWRGDIGNREADARVYEAQNRGKRIHRAWETLTMGGVVLYQPDEHPIYTKEDLDFIRYENPMITLVRYQDEQYQVFKLSKLLEILQPEIVGSELTVYSDEIRTAGTIDNVWKIKEGEYPIDGAKPLFLKGGVYIGDLKTGNVYDHDKTQMQTATYAHCYEERYGVPIEGTLGIHTNGRNKKGIYGLDIHLRTNAEMKEDFQDFRDVAKLWDKKHKGDQPQVFDFPALITLNKGVNYEQGLERVRREQQEIPKAF